MKTLRRIALFPIAALLLLVLSLILIWPVAWQLAAEELSDWGNEIVG